MYNNIEKMKEAIFKMADPNDPYSKEDFDKEFAQVKISNPDTHKIVFEFINKSNNPDPEYATDEASGFDLRAYLMDEITIDVGKREAVPTGLYFNIPKNFEIQVRPRSGLALKNGVTVLNSPGTVDSDYLGEIKVILINHGDKPFVIKNGDRIAQAVIASVIKDSIIKLVPVNKIEKDTDRGSGGFGSTGIN